MEKVKNTLSEPLHLHPNSDLILSRKASWIAMVRKHLKDVANDAEGDVMSEKNPTHVKNTGLLPQGHPTSELDNVATTSSIRDTENEGNALLQYNLRRPKRNTNLPDALRSPYVQRVVSLTNKRDHLEAALASCILSATGNKWEPIFDCPPGVSIWRGSFETIYPELCLDADIITAWVAVLNYEERLRAPGTAARLFCNVGMLVMHVSHFITLYENVGLYITIQH
ncbi:hypothetical protein HanHA300_Chr12g0432491 [Helianthus annuus]|nr:hypothetical protein HanHA300_Chr12g0432491 [Helianthus annuus]